MDKKKPIILWINGKKTNRKRNKIKNQYKSYNQEHAASSEDRDQYDKIPALSRNHPIAVKYDTFENRTQQRNIKPIIISIASAIVIGIGLGVFMLNMFVGIDNKINGDASPNGLNNTSTKSVDTDTEKNDQASSTLTLEPISAFVLQAGVFSSKENANTWSAKYQKSGFPTMVWERDGQFFLFAGVAQSEKQADLEAAHFTELDIYVKEWSTPETKKKYNELEKKWLQSYNELWTQSLNAITAGKPLSQSAWIKLMDGLPANSEKLTEFGEQLNGLTKQMEKADMTKQKIILLKQWQQYEMLVLQ